MRGQRCCGRPATRDLALCSWNRSDTRYRTDSHSKAKVHSVGRLFLSAVQENWLVQHARAGSIDVALHQETAKSTKSFTHVSFGVTLGGRHGDIASECSHRALPDLKQLNQQNAL